METCTRERETVEVLLLGLLSVLASRGTLSICAFFASVVFLPCVFCCGVVSSCEIQHAVRPRSQSLGGILSEAANQGPCC